MYKRGRTPSCDAGYCSFARKLCMLGATNKDVADADVAEKLCERAVGYKLPAIKVLGIDGKVEEIECSHPRRTAGRHLTSKRSNVNPFRVAASQAAIRPLRACPDRARR